MTNKTNTFGNYNFPAWVPEDVRNSIVSFWGVFGRTHKDWLEDAERGAQDNCYHRMYSGFGNPRLGDLVAYSLSDGKIVIGRYIHAWNNIGRLVDKEGGVHCPSSCDIWCKVIDSYSAAIETKEGRNER